MGGPRLTSTGPSDPGMNREPLIRRHPGDDSAWDLGHAYQAVGPGWWPLLRQAFAEIEAAGGEVTQVRQKIGHLDISARCKTGWLEELRDRYVNRSRVLCEVCGGRALPVEEQLPRPTRTHCNRCAERWAELGDERQLWMEESGVWLPERSGL
jgi:hypothetical protein